MLRKISIWVVVSGLFAAGNVFPQDPHFSQFYANPLYLNPALAGLHICPKIILNYRNQWPSLGQAYVTYNASYDMYIDAIHGAVGLVVTHDRAGGGIINTSMISAMYAFKFNITELLQASGAVKGGYYQRNLSSGDLVFGDTTQVDPIYGNLRNSAGAADFGAGIFLDYNDLFYGGIAVDHLTQPNVGFSGTESSPLYMKFTIHAGALIDLGSRRDRDQEREFTISPNVLYQQQFNFRELNIGLYLTIDPVTVGAWFRHNFDNADAVIPMLGFHWKSLRISYCYDYTVSRLKGSTGGAHEVSASWIFPCLEKRKTIRAIKSPHF